MPGPLIKVGDPRCHALRVQQHARDVDRGGEQLRRNAVGQRTEAVVGRDEIAVPVDHHRRIGQVPFQDALQGRADRSEPGVFRSRSGTSSDSASRTTMARPGTERPLSMKLMCRCVVPARIASSSWLTRRRVRHRRRAPANPSRFDWVITQPCLLDLERLGYSPGE
jgi:hypothetical protein